MKACSGSPLGLVSSALAFQADFCSVSVVLGVSESSVFSSSGASTLFVRCLGQSSGSLPFAQINLVPAQLLRQS
jgi:hypothetical protein